MKSGSRSILIANGWRYRYLVKTFGRIFSRLRHRVAQRPLKELLPLKELMTMLNDKFLCKLSAECVLFSCEGPAICKLPVFPRKTHGCSVVSVAVVVANARSPNGFREGTNCEPRSPLVLPPIIGAVQNLCGLVAAVIHTKPDTVVIHLLVVCIWFTDDRRPAYTAKHHC